MLPRIARPMTLAVTEDSTTMPKDSAAHCRRMISIAKNTPASGALKVAAMPPAAPQATSSRIRRSSSRSSWASVEPSAEPICTIGPSRPTDPPPPMHSADGQRLDHGDLRADPAAVAGDRDHHLRHAVPAGLPGEAVDQRPVEQPGDDRGQHHEPAAQPRHVRVGDMPAARRSRRSR